MARSRDHYPYRTLVGVLLAAMLLPALVGLQQGHSFYFNLFFSLIFLIALYTISKNRRHLIVGSALALPSLVARWWYLVGVSEGRLYIEHIFGVIFFVWIISVVFKSIATAARISADTIYGAVAVFLLLGFMWAQVYSLIVCFDPLAFSNTVAAFAEGGEKGARAVSFIYYSFVTLTTVGYGDITPQSDLAQMLSVVEGICGQFYMAVIVGSLIGLKLAQRGGPAQPGHHETSK